MKRLMLFIAAFFLTIAGQNCSEVAFQGAPKDSLVKSGDLEDPPIPPDCEEGQEGADCDVDGEPDDNFLARACGALEFETISVSASATNITLNHVRGGLRLNEVRVLTLTDIRGGLSVGKALEASLTKIRGKVALSANVLHGFVDGRGPFKAAIGDVDDITKHRGPICLSTNSINSIADTRGPMKIFGGSGAEIGTITNARGPIFLENVHVGSINNHRGPILLKNSTVDSITDQRGPVIEF